MLLPQWHTGVCCHVICPALESVYEQVSVSWWLNIFRGLTVCNFFCSIPNLQKGKQAPCVHLSGRSLLPLCHFYLEDSDFISRLSSNPEFTGHLDTDTRVIEFSTVVFVTSIRYKWRGIRFFFHVYTCKSLVPPLVCTTDPLMFWTQPMTHMHSSGSVKIQTVALFAASTHVEPSCLGRLCK